MSRVITYKGYRIETFMDGSCYRARIRKKDGSQLRYKSNIGEAWETAQWQHPDVATGQAKDAIDSGSIK